MTLQSSAGQRDHFVFELFRLLRGCGQLSGDPRYIVEIGVTVTDKQHADVLCDCYAWKHAEREHPQQKQGQLTATIRPHDHDMEMFTPPTQEHI
jgi:hypothetical protein